MSTKSSAVVHFLQTAVVLDDEAYESLEFEHPPEAAASLAGESLEDDFVPDVEDVSRGLSEVGERGVLDEKGDEVPDRPRALITEPLVEGFADYGIACAVLKPLVQGRQDEDHERLRAMARRADIIILDWQLTGPTPNVDDVHMRDDGTSLSFLTELLKEDQKYGVRFRLICIYTGNPAIEGIAQRLESAVSQVLGKAVTMNGDMSITEGPLKIILVSKKRRDVYEVTSSVTAAELPALMVKEFESLVSTGLMPDLALSALSAVRDGAHHLLHRFDSDLDPGLISHFSRAGVEATADFVRTLLTDEFSSILANPGAVDYLSLDLMTQRIAARLNESGPDYYLAVNKDSTKFVHMDFDGAMSALAESAGTGSFTAPKINQPKSRVKVDPPSLTSIFLPGSDSSQVFRDAMLVDQRLSVLSCMIRTPSSAGSNVPPVLQSGSVLVSKKQIKSEETADEESGSVREQLLFWLCLQPLCDSVRLGKSTSFPVIPLKSNHAQYADVFVEHEGAMVALTTYGVKFNQISMPFFSPDVESGVVKAASDGAGAWRFSDASGVDYRWLGQVRQWKVQKMISGIASHLDRIGLDEYEYLRQRSSS